MGASGGGVADIRWMCDIRGGGSGVRTVGKAEDDVRLCIEYIILWKVWRRCFKSGHFDGTGNIYHSPNIVQDKDLDSVHVPKIIYRLSMATKGVEKLQGWNAYTHFSEVNWRTII